MKEKKETESNLEATLKTVQSLGVSVMLLKNFGNIFGNSHT